MSRSEIQKALSISIHAPREGERHVLGGEFKLDVDISIHAPREGERQNIVRNRVVPFVFQSTLPARGSDQKYDKLGRLGDYISIHAPREGERQKCELN